MKAEPTFRIEARIRHAIAKSGVLWHSGACKDDICMCRLAERHSDLERRLSALIREAIASKAKLV